MMNVPTLYAQNPGSLEDQYEYLLGVVDSGWSMNFQDWKLTKGVAANQKLTETYSTMAQMSAVLREFYFVYLPAVNFP